MLRFGPTIVIDFVFCLLNLCLCLFRFLEKPLLLRYTCFAFRYLELHPFEIVSFRVVYVTRYSTIYVFFLYSFPGFRRLLHYFGNMFLNGLATSQRCFTLCFFVPCVAAYVLSSVRNVTAFSYKYNICAF